MENNINAVPATIDDIKNILSVPKNLRNNYPLVFDVICGKSPGVVFNGETKELNKLRYRIIYYQRKYPFIKIITRGTKLLLYDTRQLQE